MNEEMKQWMKDRIKYDDSMEKKELFRGRRDFANWHAGRAQGMRQILIELGEDAPDNVATHPPRRPTTA